MVNVVDVKGRTQISDIEAEDIRVVRWAVREGYWAPAQDKSKGTIIRSQQVLQVDLRLKWRPIEQWIRDFSVKRRKGIWAG